MKCILCATDGSTGADRAIDIAVQFAELMQADLCIVTVEGYVSEGEIRAEGDVGEAIALRAKSILVQARARAGRAGASKIRSISAWGDAAEVIMGYAQRERADAIVVGRRGRGRLAGLLLGSVSQKLVSLAPCIVVVVP